MIFFIQKDGVKIKSLQLKCLLPGYLYAALQPFRRISEISGGPGSNKSSLKNLIIFIFAPQIKRNNG